MASTRTFPEQHGPNKLSKYLELCRTFLNKYRASGFVDGYAFPCVPFGHRCFLLEGWIGCRGRILVQVTKILPVIQEFPDDFQIHTSMYRYNASVVGQGSILRYDNQHPETPHDGHPDPHHVHRFDFPRPEEKTGSPFWIGEKKWPHTSDVLDDLIEWYGNNRHLLQYPDDFATEPDRWD